MRRNLAGGLRRVATWVGVRLALVLAALVVIEIAAALSYLVLRGRWFSYTRMQEIRAAIRSHPADEQGQRDDRPLWVRRDEGAIHPYVGFVLDPNHPLAAGVHEYGFHDLTAVFEPPRDDRFIVAITGGSVAGQLWEARTPIERELRRLPGMKEREIVIIRIALGGFKQPQQCLALHYLLTLGGHFDLVINLDGFNEIALPWYDNARHGVFPFFPRGWYGRTGNLADPALVREAGAIGVLSDLRLWLAGVVSDSVLRFSIATNLLWRLGDGWLRQRLFAHREAARRVTQERPYFRTGPPGPFDRLQVLQSSAELWARSSITMFALARQHRFTYLHFLQPSQYLPGSKPLSDEERRDAIRLERGYGPVARDGYPYLRQAGRDIAAAGVPFSDLTEMFASEPRTVYGDDCCHLNLLGMELLAEQVAAVVGDELRSHHREPGSSEPARP